MWDLASASMKQWAPVHDQTPTGLGPFCVQRVGKVLHGLRMEQAEKYAAGAASSPTAPTHTTAHELTFQHTGLWTVSRPGLAF